MNITIALILAATALRPHGAEATPRDVAVRPLPPSGASATLTIDAMPYARTVTCGSYTLTGTATGGGAVTWSASPSGASGSCTGTTSWSCVVDVDPDATGEGVETITVSQSGGGSDTETIGFPSTAGLSSCFDAHNVDGSYNATLANADPVATWVDAGPAARNITQGVALSQPSFRTGIVGGNPVVRCDGGDSMAAATAADWIYLHDGNGSTVDAVVNMANTGLNTIVGTSSGGGTSRGILWRTNTTALAGFFMNDGTTTRLNLASANNVFTINTFNGHLATFSSSDTPDATAFINGTSVATGNAAAVSTLDPAAPITLCARGTGGASFMTGDIVVVRTYTAALTSTQRAINQAVDQWRLGGSFPVVAPMFWADSSSSSDITTAGSTVSSWRSNGSITANFAQGTVGQRPASTVSGASSVVDFDGADDFVSIGSASTTSNLHLFVVATIDSIGTNGTGAACNANDGLAGWTTYGGLKMRTAGGIAYVVAHNFDGSHDCAETTFTIGQKTILEMKIDGSNVSVAVDGGSFTSSASGNTSSASVSVILGAQDASNNYMDGKIHEAVFFADDLGATDRSAVISDLQSRWGL